jgi:hypothetical protein
MPGFAMTVIPVVRKADIGKRDERARPLSHSTVEGRPGRASRRRIYRRGRYVYGSILLNREKASLAELDKAREVCDQAVTTILTTKDALELDCARFLVGALNCRILSRL